MPLGGGMQRKLTFGIGFGIKDRPLVRANKRVDKFKNKVIRSTGVLGALERKAVVAGNAIRNSFDKAKEAVGRGVSVLERYRNQLGIAAGAGALAITKAVNMAGSANEIVNKFGVVFGRFADKTRQWAEQYSNQIGRSRYATMQWLSSFQDVLYPLGFARERAAQLSTNLVSLAADLGSFNDIATSRAASMLQSALVGNLEAVRQLGITVSAADVKMYAYKNNIAEVGEELNTLQKAQARMGIFTARSTDAIGDAVRTSEEWNNQIQRLKGNLRDSAIVMGNVYMPTFNRGLVLVNKFLDRLEASPKLKLAARIFGIATAVTGLGAAIGFVAHFWPVIAGFFTITNFAIAGALVGLVLIVEDLWVGLRGGPSVIVPIINKFLSWMGINKDLTGVLKDVGAGIKWLWGVITSVYKYFEPLVESTLGGVIDILQGSTRLILSPFRLISGLIGGLITGDFSQYQKGLEDFYGGLKQIFGGIKKIGTGAFDFMVKRWSQTIQWLTEFEMPGPKEIGSKISGWWNKVLTGWGEIDTKDIAPGLEKAIKGVINWIKNIDLPDLPSPKLPELPDVIGGVKSKFNEAMNWVQDNPLTVVRFLVPAVNLPDIINGIYETGRQFVKKHTGIELPELHIPTLPDLVGGIKSKYTAAKKWISNKFDLSLPGIGFPELPDPIAKIRNWADGIKTELENVDFGSPLKSAINSAMDMLPGWMQGMAKKIMNFLPQSPAKEGPLSKLDKVGPGLVNTVGKGIDKSKNILSNSVSKLWEKATPSLIQPQVAPAGIPQSVQVTGFASNGYSSPGYRKEVTNNTFNESNSAKERLNIQNINIDMGGNSSPDDSDTIRKMEAAARKVFHRVFEEEYTSSVSDA